VPAETPGMLAWVQSRIEVLSCSSLLFCSVQDKLQTEFSTASQSVIQRSLELANYDESKARDLLSTVLKSFSTHSTDHTATTSSGTGLRYYKFLITS
jgi:hypothetical protein